MCGIILFCSSYYEVAHCSVSNIEFSTGTIAFVYDMGWVRVFVLEVEYALYIPGLPQELDRVLVNQ